ncbi:hypothetical protein Q3G72_014169 [Acer saccharum]|nr:hypothetical protein Q3G72_014169 [Acer saccharum]
MASATLKLLIDDKRNRVVYAEAGKNFVDFLFGLMQVPLGSIMLNCGTTGRAGQSGSLGCIYRSVAELDPSYLLKDVNKDSLLRPNMSSSSATNTPPLLQKFKIENRDYYGYSSSSRDEKKEDGFVKGTTQYMVMDNLTVKLMSTISSITVLNDLRIENIGSLKEKIVTVDSAKALELVKASFVSDTVLTDVFVTSDTKMARVG